MQPFRFSRLRLLIFTKQKREDRFAFLPSHFRFVKNKRRKREMAAYVFHHILYFLCCCLSVKLYRVVKQLTKVLIWRITPHTPSESVCIIFTSCVTFRYLLFDLLILTLQIRFAHFKNFQGDICWHIKGEVIFCVHIHSE